MGCRTNRGAGPPAGSPGSPAFRLLDAALPPDNIHDRLQKAAEARPEVLASKAQQQAAIEAHKAEQASKAGPD